jgi:hypothetical protein
LYDNFSIAILKAYYNFIYNNQFLSFQSFMKEARFYITPYISIPFSKSNTNEILINYIKRDKFTRVSFIDIYNKNSLLTMEKTVNFKNKILIV